MKARTKGRLIKGAAVALDVAAPLTATLAQFPLWIDKSTEATISGLALVLIVISCIPFFKQIKTYFKSPSVWVLMTVLFVAMVLLRNIIDQIIVVAFVGMISNMAGAVIYNFGKRIEEKEDKET